MSLFADDWTDAMCVLCLNIWHWISIEYIHNEEMFGIRMGRRWIEVNEHE